MCVLPGYVESLTPHPLHPKVSTSDYLPQMSSMLDVPMQSLDKIQLSEDRSYAHISYALEETRRIFKIYVNIS